MHSPLKSHLKAMYRILRYLKSSINKGILYLFNGNLWLEACTKDWAGSLTDKKSVLGYCTQLGGNLITMRSKKQSMVARSSVEAEFRVMALGICELLWMKIVFTDFKVKTQVPMMVYCDNKVTINIAYNLVHHDKTKHLEIDQHFIKEKMDSEQVCTPYVPSTK